MTCVFIRNSSPKAHPGFPDNDEGSSDRQGDVKQCGAAFQVGVACGLDMAGCVVLRKPEKPLTVVHHNQES